MAESGIRWGRVIGGGIVAGIVANVLEMAFGFLMRARWAAAMPRASMEKAAQGMAAHLAWSFVIGIAAIWLYAAIRPRYGPGPATAVKAGLAVWLFAHATFALATVTLGVFPANLMVISAVWGLVESIVATLAGAAIYKETG